MIDNNSYLKFLGAFHKLEVAQASAGLDLIAERLLGHIGVSHSLGQTLTVTECMQISTVASPATIHKKIYELCDQGWVNSHYDGANRRTKYLAPTAKAIKHFDKIAKLLEKSAA
jgi:hypothetical protein